MPRGSNMRTPKVEIIVVKYNQMHFEATTLEQVANNTEYPNYSLRAYQNERGVALSKCWNRLIAASDAEYICLLNSDTVVSAGWLTGLMNIFEAIPNVGAVVPSSNQVFLSQIPIPFSHDTVDFSVIHKFALATAARETECLELPTLSGMCVVFPRALWEKIGGFDEEFFLYGEDTEFFYRLHEQTGKLLVWYKGVYVHHYKARSTMKAAAEGELDIQAVRARASELCQRKMPKLQVSHGDQ